MSNIQVWTHLESCALVLLLIGVSLVAITIAIWPARSERRWQLLEALSYGIAGDDWP